MLTFFDSQSEFHKWLKTNHNRAEELWIGFWKVDSKKKGITYPQALDEALCFGWIDGIRKSIDDNSYKIRFTPRKKSSKWSKVNSNRANELMKSGKMMPAGKEAFEKRDEGNRIKYSFEEKTKNLSSGYEKLFKSNKQAWEFFRNMPAYYKKTASFWVMSAKREETSLRRLNQLISDSQNQKRIDAMNPKLYMQRRNQKAKEGKL